MNTNEIEAKALTLRDARLTAKPISSFPENLDLKNAQEILRKGIDLRVQRGEEITGIVLQSNNYFSYLTNQMNLISGGSFSLKDCILPRVSAHLVYYIDHRLEGPSTLQQIVSATSSISLALLITDSRFEKGQEVTLSERIADNFFSTYYFLGKRRLDIREMNERSVRLALYFNNQKKLETEIADVNFGLTRLSKDSALSLGPSSIVLSPNLFDDQSLGPNMDISLVGDYFGTINFKAI
jgi:2-keto-4-pentenoate hydratase